MTLTPEQFARLQQLKLNGGSQLEPTNAKSFLRPQQLLSSIGGTFKNEFSDAAKQIMDAQQRQSSGQQGAGRTLFTALSQGAQAGLSSAFSGALDIASAATPDFIENPIRRSAGDKLQNFIQSPEGADFIKTAKEIGVVTDELFNNLGIDTSTASGAQFKKDIGATLLTALDIGTVGGAKSAGKPVASAIKEGVSATGDAVKGGTKGLVRRVTPETFKNFVARLNPSDRVSSQSVLKQAYKSAFIDDNPTVVNKLKKLAAQLSFNNVRITPDDLVDNLIDEGIIPSLEGKLSNFAEELAKLTAKQTSITNAIQPRLRSIVDLTSLDALRKTAMRALNNSAIVEDLPLARRQLGRFFDAFEAKFGKKVSAEQLNTIVTKMNGRTKAFGEETFKQDTANVIAREVRKVLDNLVEDGDVRAAWKEWGRLQSLKDTISIFDTRKVKISDLGEALGRWTGVVTLGASGIGFAAGGPGGLVIASLAAKFGGDVIAQFLRNKKFSQRAKTIIIEALRDDQSIVKKLIKNTDAKNKAILERLLLEPPKAIQLGAKTPSKSFVKSVPAKKGTGRDLKTGRFKRVFQSVGEAIKDQRGFVKNPLSKGKSQSKLKRQGVSSTKSSTKIKGKADPLLKTKRKVVAKDLSGNKIIIPKDTVIKPLIADGKTYIKVDSKQYVINKNQYNNLKGQSDVSVATPFAPELKDTVETVRGGSNIEGEIDLLLADEFGAGMTRAEARDFINQNAESVVATKYERYTLPGGKNYREIIMQAPNKGEVYKSAHWDEPNPIFHLRMNDRTWKGKKVTFMEELQSDWAREGREKGFITTNAGSEINELKNIVRKMKMGERRTSGEVSRHKELTTKLKAEFPEWKNQYSSFDDFILNKEAVEADKVPYHPLLKNWQIPATKRALMDAVGQDSNIFAWINGAQTSERYKLSTQVEKINWSDTGTSLKTVNISPKEQTGGFQLVVDDAGKITTTNGTQRLIGDWKGKKLDEVLGKGMADSIMSKKSGTLKGEGLDFGGEWAVNLYDRQVRDIVKKLTGAEVKKADMGLPIEKKLQFTKLGRDEGGAVRINDLKKGVQIADQKGTGFVITEVVGGGKFKALQKSSLDDTALRNVEKWAEDLDFDHYAKRLAEKNNLSVSDKWVQDMVKAKKKFVENHTKQFDIGSQNAVQQYIELTPEVKAKIRSEAPKFKMKNEITTYGIPLVLLAIGANQ